jgi:hypothetical protein
VDGENGDIPPGLRNQFEKLEKTLEGIRDALMLILLCVGIIAIVVVCAFVGPPF